MRGRLSFGHLRSIERSAFFFLLGLTTGVVLMFVNMPSSPSPVAPLPSPSLMAPLPAPHEKFVELMRAAGISTACTTTWPGLLKAESPGEANCPWLGPWPAAATAAQPYRRVSASLTTYAARWQKNPLLLIAAIWSLLNQTLTPDVVYIALPKSSRGVNGGKVPFDPKGAALIEAFPRVRILWTSDYGPATKFLAALHSPEVPKDTLLYVCDDDRRIPTRLLEALARWARRPGYERAGFGVWGVSGAHERFRVKGGPGPGGITAEEWSYRYPDAETVPDGPLRVERPPVPVEMLLGTNGYMIPKAPFAEDMDSFFRVPPQWRIPFWSEDDNFMACQALRHNVKLYVIADPNYEFNCGRGFGVTYHAGGQTLGDGCDSGDCISGAKDKGSKYSEASKIQSTCDVNPCTAHPESCVDMYEPDFNGHAADFKPAGP